LKGYLESHADAAVREAFAFAGARCDRIVGAVFQRLASAPPKGVPGSDQ
jgi:hypothetical protein